MIRAIVSFCVREPLIVLSAVVVSIVAGWISLNQVPLDAIPNVGDNQVIVLTEWPGRSPKDIEDQVTYPLSVDLQAVPGARSVRGKSMFGFSFVQVTFDDDVDFYWARSRVSEQLTAISSKLPEGVTPALGPDATALGQIYYYVIERPPTMDLAEARTLQDYVVRYALQSVDGVAEVASIGGYVHQYQVEVDPDKLRFHDIALSDLINAVKNANVDVGAKTVESSGMEFIVRGRGFIGSGKSELETIEQIENTVVESRGGVPIRVIDLADVQTGPSFRRGALDFNGQEAVGGVVVMRYGENPRNVIKAVREKIDSLEGELDGAKIHGVYDRTFLIDETVGTLSTALGQQIVITILVVVMFLLNVRASVVVAFTLPLAVLLAFVAMNLFGVDANIMSLAGIAIAIGTMVDMGIIVSENIYRKLADWESEGRTGGRFARLQTIRESSLEVIPAVVTAVLTTVVSFLPVFLLTGRDHRLFAPLAWTKTFALIASLIVAVAVVPCLSRLFLRSSRQSSALSTFSGFAFGTLLSITTFFIWGKQLEAWLGIHSAAIAALIGLGGFILGYWLLREEIRPIDRNPIALIINWAYAPTLSFLLKRKLLFLNVPVLIFLLGIGAWRGLPQMLRPLEQLIGVSGADVNEFPGYVNAKHTFTGLRSDDWIALDEGSWFYMPSLYPAASFSQAMEVLQTQDALIEEIPEVANVLGKIGRVDSALDPAPAAMIETYVMLKPKSEWRPGVSERDIWNEINSVATLPGVTPAAPLQPIEGRVVMLQSGIKASMAIRIYGDDLDGLAEASASVAAHLKEHPLVVEGAVNPDIVLGKPYYEFEIDREEAARYGMTTMMVNEIVAAGLGGMDVTTTVEGRERYPIQIRYQRDVRENIDQLNEVPVVTHNGEVVPLDRLAHVETLWGPGAINSEDARLVAHVAFSPNGRAGDLETVRAVENSLREARQNGQLKFPVGNYEMEPVGSFESQVEANNRLLWLIPLVVLINLSIIYCQFRKIVVSLIVVTGIPVAFGGGMILLGILDVEINTAVWVGFIALFGIAVDDGVVIATYLEQTFSQRRMTTIDEIRQATITAGLRRIRPCLMTTATTIVALMPVLVSTGRGADVAQAMALPVVGGMCFEFITLFVVPVVYCGYQEWRFALGLEVGTSPPPNEVAVRQETT